MEFAGVIFSIGKITSESFVMSDWANYRLQEPGQHEFFSGSSVLLNDSLIVGNTPIRTLLSSGNLLNYSSLSFAILRPLVISGPSHTNLHSCMSFILAK